MTHSIRSAVVVGCGSAGRRHLKNLQNLGVSRIFTIDDDPGAARQPGADPLPSIEDAVREGARVAVIATPPSSHVALARRSLAAGLDVYVEKPLSNVWDGVPALLEEARRSGRMAAVGYNWRFHPSFRAMKSAVETGVLGALVGGRIHWGRTGGPERTTGACMRRGPIWAAASFWMRTNWTI
jgi:predicted dehydrogenase